jgi:hypothetical protein
MEIILTPEPRHRKGWDGTRDALGFVIVTIGGVGELIEGRLWIGLALVLGALFFLRDAYLKYLSGNWMLKRYG